MAFISHSSCVSPSGAVVWAITMEEVTQATCFSKWVPQNPDSHTAHHRGEAAHHSGGNQSEVSIYYRNLVVGSHPFGQLD